MADGIVTLVRLLQPLNALFPMLVTVAGIVTLVSEAKPSSKRSGISVSFPRSTLVRPVQPLNALLPMLVTLFRSTCARLVQSLNVPLGISVTPGGTVKSVRLVQF